MEWTKAVVTAYCGLDTYSKLVTYNEIHPHSANAM